MVVRPSVHAGPFVGAARPECDCPLPEMSTVYQVSITGDPGTRTVMGAEQVTVPCSLITIHVGIKRKITDSGNDGQRSAGLEQPPCWVVEVSSWGFLWLQVQTAKMRSMRKDHGCPLMSQINSEPGFTASKQGKHTSTGEAIILYYFFPS